MGRTGQADPPGD